MTRAAALLRFVLALCFVAAVPLASRGATEAGQRHAPALHAGPSQVVAAWRASASAAQAAIACTARPCPMGDCTDRPTFGADCPMQASCATLPLAVLPTGGDLPEGRCAAAIAPAEHFVRIASITSDPPPPKRSI